MVPSEGVTVGQGEKKAGLELVPEQEARIERRWSNHQHHHRSCSTLSHPGPLASIRQTRFVVTRNHCPERPPLKHDHSLSL